ncbi:DnaJ-domain-containing protein [Nemania sp. FL0916]|nr:DnaJ-domain-containing protein [Nemania sp. FL0916]
MPPRSAVSLLAAPAPVQRHCICAHDCFGIASPPLGLFTLRKPALLPKRRYKSYGPIVKTTAVGRRSFHSSAARSDDAADHARTHYETLKVAPNASPAEIKKSFYNLSKAHHPDLHEASARRAASKRFMQISEAYTVLSSPARRAKYDRDHLGLSASATTSARKSGSYASTGPAGGRPASGLSRRRGTFTGPPPSFFRSGGWGAQADKRRAAHDDSTGSSSSSSGTWTWTNTGTTTGSGPGTGAGSMGGMGPGQDPFGHRDDVPHFDKASHQRTGRHSDKRREARRAAAGTDDTGRPVTIEPERGIAGMFFAIGGVLLLSLAGPLLIGRIWTVHASKRDEKGVARGRRP